MKKRLIFLSLLFILLPGTRLFGNELYNTNREVIISSEWQSFDDTSSEVFFLFSNATFRSVHKGNAYFLFSTTAIESNFLGNIYSFLSEININENADIEGQIFSLSSLIISKRKDISVKSLGFWENLFFSIDHDSDGFYYDSRLPAIVFFVALCVLRQILCMTIYALRSEFFNQGSVLLDEDSVDVIQFGLLTYALILASSLVFLISVAGVIFTFAILIISFLLSLLGQISLEISLGGLLLQKFGIKKTPYRSIFIGGMIIEVVALLPIIGISANLLFLPILSLGMFTTNFVNGFYRKKYFVVDFDQDHSIPLNKTDRDSIRNIITKGW